VRCHLTGALAVHVTSSPPLPRQTEEQVSAMLSEAGRIVSRMKTPQSTVTALLDRLRQNLSALERDEIRERLKREVSAALTANRIPPGMIDTITMVFVNLLMEGSDLPCVQPGESIILYLKCGSVLILLRLRGMVLSGVLLRLFSEVIKQFIRSRPRIQLVLKTEDYNFTLSFLRIVAGKSACRLLCCAN